jgi:hypothetical protein
MSNERKFIKLTAAQKRKADRIVKLVSELSEQGITTSMIATPDSRLVFYKSPERWNDMEDIQAETNREDSRAYLINRSDLLLTQPAF